MTSPITPEARAKALFDRLAPMYCEEEATQGQIELALAAAIRDAENEARDEALDAAISLIGVVNTVIAADVPVKFGDDRDAKLREILGFMTSLTQICVDGLTELKSPSPKEQG